MSGLFNRIIRVCTNDAIDDDVRLLNKTLVETGYPLKFINRWKGHGILRPTITLAERNLSTSFFGLEVIQIAFY